MIELDTAARAQSLLRHQLALLLSMLAVALIFLFFTALAEAEDEDLVVVLDIDPASTSGKEGVRMESEPLYLSFRPGKTVENRLLSRCFHRQPTAQLSMSA